MSLNDVIAAIAHESIRISPYPVPVDLEVVLKKVHALIVDQGFERPNADPSFLFRMMTRRQLYGLLDEQLKLIPEFCRWNITKAEQLQGWTDPDDPNRPMGFGMVGRGTSTPPADNDFVDLDAHIGNAVALAWFRSAPEE